MLNILLIVQSFALDLKNPSLSDAASLLEKECPKFACSKAADEKCLGYEDKSNTWTFSPCKDKFECPDFDATFFDKKVPQTCKNAEAPVQE